MSIQDGLNKRKNRTEEEKAKRRELQIQTGNRLRRLREDKNISQQEMADMLGFGTQAAYGKLEGGDVALHPRQCIMLADYFGVTCDYILRGIDTENVDICMRTCLTQETVQALTIMQSDYAKTKRDLQQIQASYNISIEEVAKQGNVLPTETTEKLSDEYYRNIQEPLKALRLSNVRKWIINAFINNTSFLDELGKAGEKMLACTAMRLYDYFPFDDGFDFEDLSIDEYETGVNASRYVAGVAFANFFSEISTNAEFISCGYKDDPDSNLDELVLKGIEVGLLHSDRKDSI